MSTLYQLGNDFQTLYNALDDIDLSDRYGSDLMSAYFDTLEGIETEFEQKAETIALMIKQLVSEAEGIKNEKQNLLERQLQKEKKAEQLKQYLKNNMDLIGIAKIEMPRAKITVGNNAESVKILDIDLLKNCEKAWKTYRYQESNIEKTELKKLLQAGEIIPGAELQRTRRITIK